MSGNDFTTYLQREQLKFLVEQLPVGLIATVVNAVVLTSVLYIGAEASILLYWLGALCVVTLLRAVLYFYYHEHDEAPNRTRLLLQMFYLGVILSGLVWGAAAFFLFPVDEHTEHQLVLVFVLAGMAAGGSATLSPVWYYALTYQLLMLLPLLIKFEYLGGHIHLELNFMIVLFIVTLASSAWRMNQVFIANLRLRYDSERMLEE